MDYTKALYGEHAMRSATQLILQDMGLTHDNKYMTMIVGVMISDTPMLSEKAQELEYQNELIIGDVVIRPLGKWASNEYAGYGAEALLKSEAMFPDGYEIQTLENGYTPKKRQVNIGDKISNREMHLGDRVLNLNTEDVYEVTEHGLETVIFYNPKNRARITEKLSDKIEWMLFARIHP